MQTPEDLRKRLMERYGGVIDLNKDPRILDDLWAEMSAPAAKAAPFGISWMDSWVAHHVYEDNLKSAAARSPELVSVLRGLADLKFNERLKEIQQFLNARRLAEPPDGGPPEPGTPPAGPAAARRFAAEPPDGGTPEPGVPNPPAGPAAHRFAVAEPPDSGTPEPGVPMPAPPPPPAGPAAQRFAIAEPPDGGTPEPGVPMPAPPPPPAGPDAGFLRENPWILYWFISIQAPMLLDVIDAHITKRLDALQFGSVR